MTELENCFRVQWTHIGSRKFNYHTYENDTYEGVDLVLSNFLRLLTSSFNLDTAVRGLGIIPFLEPSPGIFLFEGTFVSEAFAPVFPTLAARRASMRRFRPIVCKISYIHNFIR